MTEKEALETINRLGISARGYMNLKEAINIAIISLDKQIPKKGKIVIEGKPENGGSYGVRICPSCGKRIDIYGDYIGCPYCLQRVDWREE